MSDHTQDAEAFMRALWSLPQSAGDLPPDIVDGYTRLRTLLWQAQVSAAAQALMPSEVAELSTVETAQDLTPEAIDRVRRWLALGLITVDSPWFLGDPPKWRLTALGNAALELLALTADGACNG